MTYRLFIAKEFSEYPMGRNEAQGDFNGELFREKILRPALAEHPHVTLDFTGVKITVGSSFLKEAVAGLINKGNMSRSDLKARLAIDIPADPTKENTAWKWVDEAEELRLARSAGGDTAEAARLHA